jgi:DNA-binding MarR family transcriptional regulator
MKGNSLLHNDATDTEVEAYEKTMGTVERLRLDVLMALMGGSGTGSEIAERSGIDVLNVRPRLTELTQMGQAYDTGIRRKNERSNNERVIAITQRGIETVRRKTNVHEDME